MLWEYKRKFSKDKNFEKAVEDRFCAADLKRVSRKNRLQCMNYIVIPLINLWALQKLACMCQ